MHERQSESGQTLVEYALIIALVSLAAIAALGFLSGKIQNVFSKSGNSLAAVEASIGSGGGGTPPPPPPPPAPVPTPGSVNITCPGGGCGDGETLTATTSGWANGPITNHRFVWARNDSFLDPPGPNNETCVTNAQPGWGDVETDNGAGATQTYNSPIQGSGSGDSIRVQVYATNSGGESTAVAEDCVWVEND